MNQQKNKLVVALSIDKVQTLLFEVIKAHVQEKQKETATLKNIVHSSNDISEGFFQEIKQAFAEVKRVELLACSGVYIFWTSGEKEKINNILKNLFHRFYQNSQGQKILKYICLEEDTTIDEITMIQHAKKELKNSACLNHIIRDNQKLLFEFTKDKKEKKLSLFIKDSYSFFVRGINDLNSIKNEEGKQKHFRIAVIKADLDGMGKMFQDVKNFETYKKMSEILNETICLNGFHEFVKDYDNKAGEGSIEKNKPWLLPFYIAGDDIFFAVSIANMVKGINLCREMLRHINEKLKAVKIEHQLSISIGVDIVFNKEPIRYYLSMVENQLKNAKKIKLNKLAIGDYVQGKVSIHGGTYLFLNEIEYKAFKSKLKEHKLNCNCEDCKKNIQINKEKMKYSIWNYVISDLKVLNAIKINTQNSQEKVGSNHFFYTLLENLSREDLKWNKEKYLVTLLYLLRPKHMENISNIRNQELILKKNIMKQLYQKSEIEGIGDCVEINPETRKKLRSYLQFMLLLSDERFQIGGIEEQKNNKNKEQEQKEIKKYLFDKPLKYLYEINCKGRNIYKLFIQKKYFIGEKGHRIYYYQTLKIEKSMFYRLLETDKIPFNKAVSMIEVSNSKLEEDAKENKDNNKVKYYLDFNKKYFETEKNKKAWKQNLIEFLLVFYMYNEYLIQFKTIKKQRKVKR